MAIAHFLLECLYGLLRAVSLLLTLLAIRYLLEISNPLRDIVMVRDMLIAVRDAFAVPSDLAGVNMTRLEHLRDLTRQGFYANDIHTVPVESPDVGDPVDEQSESKVDDNGSK